MKPFRFLLTISLFFLLMTLACRPTPPKVEEPKKIQEPIKVQEPISVKAADLLAAYLAAPADKQTGLIYNDKRLLVTGVVGSVKPEEGLVILKGKEDAAILNGVKCYLRPTYENNEGVKRLNMGQEIGVEGDNGGYTAGFVELTRCELKIDKLVRKPVSWSGDS